METLGTTTSQSSGVTIDSGLEYGMYTGQSASSATQTAVTHIGPMLKPRLVLR